jgi:hypothetical protein
LVGEAAHVVAEQLDGPRGDSDLPLDQRNKYENLILLCNVHHKQVDDQENYFTVQKLKEIKYSHEAWVRSSLNWDSKKQVDDERWAAYIDDWAKRAKLDNWLGYTSYLLVPTPIVAIEFLESLRGLCVWLLSRVWPTRYERIRHSLESFRFVVTDLLLVFARHSEHDAHRPNEYLITASFYKGQPYEHDVYTGLLLEFEHHVALIHDLVLEMTRAANYVCDLVRENIDPSFRMKEGVLLVERSDAFTCETKRVEYREGERTSLPYPGLDNFLIVRETRDQHVGAGAFDIYDDNQL